MKNLTKEQRHKLYVLAFQHYKHRVKNQISSGMCASLETAYHKIDREGSHIMFSQVYYTKLINILPEFKALAPKSIKHIGNKYWWDPADTESRIKSFESIIEKTKP